jgi:hypothetical protein
VPEQQLTSLHPTGPGCSANAGVQNMRHERTYCNDLVVFVFLLKLNFSVDEGA